MAIESKMPRGPFGRIAESSLPKNENNPKKKKVTIWIVLFLIIICFGLLLFLRPFKVLLGETLDIDSTTYQAVFLDNGQVYFGRLDPNPKSDFYELIDVFYITNTAMVELDDTASLSLRKLGGEAHGPTDQMLINGEHILFVEDIRSDSKVSEAISSYKSRQ